MSNLFLSNQPMPDSQAACVFKPYPFTMNNNLVHFGHWSDFVHKYLCERNQVTVHDVSAHRNEAPESNDCLAPVASILPAKIFGNTVISSCECRAT